MRDDPNTPWDQVKHFRRPGRDHLDNTPDFIPPHANRWLRIAAGVMLAFVVLALCVLIVLIAAQPVHAHSWYDQTCCSDKDCAPIPDESVRATPSGWHVRLEPGDHPLIKHTIDVVIPYGSEDVLRSEDEQFHACVSMGSPSADPTVLCLYVTGSGA